MNKDEFRRTTRIKDQYIHDLYDDEDNDRFIGATNIKILGFRDNMDTVVGYPWGEVGVFETSSRTSNTIPDMCDIHGYELSEFELLVEEYFRVRVKHIGNGFDKTDFNVSWSDGRARPIDTEYEHDLYPEVGTYEDEEPTQIEIDNIWDLMGRAMIVLGAIVLIMILLF